MNNPNPTPAPDMAVEAREREALARQLLEAEYLTGGVEGPYPTYAELARNGKGAFTLCSIRAIEKALMLGRPQEVAATMFHDAGAIAQCGYCKRYTMDRSALTDRQPMCTCGDRYGWSGSFKPPGPDAIWHGTPPASRAPVAVGVEPMRKHVEDFATRHGWKPEDGEGAFEFVQRISYAQGLEDAKGRAGAGGSVGAEPAVYDGVHGHPEFGAGAVPLGGGEVLKDEAIGAAWDAAKARLAHDPYTPKEAFWAGAIFGAAHPLQAQDAAPVLAGVQGDAARLAAFNDFAALNIRALGLKSLEVGAPAWSPGIEPRPHARGVANTQGVDHG